MDVPDGTITSTAAIPVGGGAVFPAHRVVVTQPVEGEFAGFDSTCTHRGCTVRSVVAGTINCLCHGSRFRIADGSVAGGPAPAPLPRRALVVTGGLITLAPGRPAEPVPAPDGSAPPPRTG